MHKKQRNPVACSPILRKGGPHLVSRSGARKKAKLSTQHEVEQWLDDINLEATTKGSKRSPSFFKISNNFL